MTYELRELQGSLFPNGKKTESKHPDWTGKVKINGDIYRLSGWEREGKTKWISIAAQKLVGDFTAAKEAVINADTTHAPELNSEIPF